MINRDVLYRLRDATAVALAFAFILGTTFFARAQTPTAITLTNVSYDPTR